MERLRVAPAPSVAADHAAALLVSQIEILKIIEQTLNNAMYSQTAFKRSKHILPQILLECTAGAQSLHGTARDADARHPSRARRSHGAVRTRTTQSFLTDLELPATI